MKIIRLLLLLLITAQGYSQQLPLENFRYDGDALPPGWMVYQNDVGTNITWGLSIIGSNAAPGREFPAIADDQAAYLNRGNVTSGNPEDWLVTKKFTVPTNGELRFWTRLVQAAENGSVFDIRISNANVNPDGSNLSTYTSLIDSDGWTETELAGTGSQQLLYKEKVISLSAFAGQEVYIAFWMRAPSSGSDRWLIDDVRVGASCGQPTNAIASNLTTTSAQLSWTPPAGSSQTEIQIVHASEPPTGVGQLIIQNSIIANQTTAGQAFNSGSTYRYYLRSHCNNGFESEWIGPINFTIPRVGESCAYPHIISSLPYIKHETSQEAGSFYGGNPGLAAGCGANSADYLEGQHEVYQYTAQATTTINISLTPSQANTGFFIYNSCANIGVNCMAGTGDNTTALKSISGFSVTAGQTYYIVVASKNILGPYILTLNQNNCSNNITATFGIQSDCLEGSDFYVTANITGMGSATSIEAVSLPLASTSSSQIVNGPGLITFGPFAHNDRVNILLKNQQNPNCLALSRTISKQSCVPINDNCSNATVLPVEIDNCKGVWGNLEGATASLEPSTCDGAEDDDVWYEFTAINTRHIISLTNIQGTHLDLNHAVYLGGNCGTLTQLYCSDNNISTAENLTIGQVYKIRVFSAAAQKTQTSFFICTTAFSPTCLDTNPRSAEVRQLFVNLVNHLIDVANNSGGAIPSPYNCPQLTALAPFIIDPNPSIYNATLGGGLSFSFSAGTSQPHIQLNGINNYIYDINFNSYTSASTSVSATVSFLNGTLDNIRKFVSHVNFCPVQCPDVNGQIQINPGISCIIPNKKYDFSFQGDTSAITGYSWTFYNIDGTTVKGTSSSAVASMDYLSVGTYLVKLVVTTFQGCTKEFTYNVTVKVNCTSCTDNNPQTAIVKQLYIALVNHLKSVATNGPIPNGYSCQQLTNLAPYITVANPLIYNASYVGGTLQFSFTNTQGYDVYVATHPPVNNLITNVDLSSYASSSTLGNYKLTFQDGTTQLKHFVKNINFCPDPPSSCSTPVTGKIVPLSSCVIIGKEIIFQLETNASGITEYTWTLYNTDGSVLAQSNDSSIATTYTAFGNYQIKVVINYGTGCTATYFKNITVRESCSSCTIDNEATPFIQQLYVDLLTHLIQIYVNGGSVPNGYNCPELEALAPYITDSDPRIYSPVYIDNTLTFSFHPQKEKGEYDVSVPVIGIPASVNVSNFTDADALTEYLLTYANGYITDKHLARHINFCFDKCIPISAYIKSENKDCFKVDETYEFSIETDSSLSGYSWTIYNSNGSIINTSNNDLVQMHFPSPGNYTIKVVVTDKNGCTGLITKIVRVLGKCSPSCATGEDGQYIEHLYLSLINHLLNIYSSGGSVPSGYTCPQLQALAPFITDTHPAIYHPSFDGINLSFSFHDHNDPDVIVPVGGVAVNIDLYDFTDASVIDKYYINFANGYSTLNHFVRHVDFCSNKDSCKQISGYIRSDQAACFGVKKDYRFYLAADVAPESYLWTFYNPDGSFLYSSTEASPTYNFSTAGTYTAQLVITIKGCTSVYTKIITVKDDCSDVKACAMDPEPQHIKQLYINLVNHLLNIYNNGGTVSNGYDCPQLQLLAPFITYPSPLIYGASYVGGVLKFKFTQSGGYDISVKNMGPLADINLYNYVTYTGTNHLTVYNSGAQSTQHFISHINFCNENPEEPQPPCQPIAGSIKLNSGVSCILLNQAQGFSFQSITPVTGYTWTFYGLNGTSILTTSQASNPVFSYSAVGNYLVKLVVNYGNGCSAQFIKSVFVNTSCTQCTETNPKSGVVKELYLNLINHLLAYAANNVIPNGYTCPELTALKPYINDSNPSIYNPVYDGQYLKFSFDNHGTDNANYDVIVPVGGIITDLNLLNYTAGNTQVQYQAIYSNGELKNHTIRHIDFCPTYPNPCVLNGSIALNSGISCVTVNTPISLNFNTTSTVSSHIWLFYNIGAQSVMSTSLSPTPSMVYSNDGDYLVTLIATEEGGCTKVFQKLIRVRTSCTACTETNTQSVAVKQLYKNLLDHLLGIYTTGGSVPNGYNCIQLVALAPYLTDVNPRIYHSSYNNQILKFSFANHGPGQYDVMIANYGQISDIDIYDFASENSATTIGTFFSNGNLTLTHTAKHIKFCPPTGPAVPCVEINGTIALTNGLLCLPIGIPKGFYFQTNAANVTAYSWKFYNIDGTTVLATSTVPYPTYTYNNAGIYKVELTITYANNCTKTFTKNFIARETCEACTENNSQSATIKQLYIALINNLYHTYTNMGSIPNGYNCAELIALKDYITDSNPLIYNVSYINQVLKFSFHNHGSAYYDVSIPLNGYVTDIDLYPFETAATLTDFTVFYANGSQSTANKIRHINFCPGDCTSGSGSIKLTSGIACVVPNTPQEFYFYSSSANIASYQWTFYSQNGNTVMATSQLSHPSMTYATVGNYLIRLKITYNNGCTDEFSKLITVSPTCNNACTESNEQSGTVKSLYVDLVNHLLGIYAANGTVQNGYTCPQLVTLTPYINVASPAIYNVTYSNQVLQFSFTQNSGGYDVSVPNIGVVTDVNIFNYVNTQANQYQAVYSNGSVASHTIRNITFCPIDEFCESHVAFVIDESGSISASETAKIRKQLHDFINNQLQAFNTGAAEKDMTISFIGMADSDEPNKRPNSHHVLEQKVTPATVEIFRAWINKYNNGYTTTERQQGLSENSDYWASGLRKAMSSNIKPDLIFVIADGSQTGDLAGLKTIINTIRQESELYVYGLSDGHYVDGNMQSDAQNNLYPGLTNNDTSNPNITMRLRNSLKFLMQMAPTSFPVDNRDDFIVGDFTGQPNFDHLASDARYLSDKLANAGLGCGGAAIPKEYCNDCQTFQPTPGKTYWISAWVKEEQNIQVHTYTKPVLKIIFLNGSEEHIATLPFSPSPSEKIIDGWQRIAEKFTIPPLTRIMSIELENLSSSVPVYFDDIRIHPVNGSMKSFVYDPETFRLMAEHDDNNYSTYYEYDNEGGLVRIKKETSEGIKTIQETRSGTVIQPQN